MAIDVSGRWYNQHGSEIDLRVEPGGRIRGTFRTATGCANPDEEYEVTGFQVGTLLGFSVGFPKYDSVTSWAGHVGTEDGKPTIYALWHMSVGLPGPARPDQLWEGIWAGADTFLRKPVAARRVDRPRLRSHPGSRAAGYPV